MMSQLCKIPSNGTTVQNDLKNCVVTMAQNDLKVVMSLLYIKTKTVWHQNTTKRLEK
jgi:hypothetical protein